MSKKTIVLGSKEHWESESKIAKAKQPLPTTNICQSCDRASDITDMSQDTIGAKPDDWCWSCWRFSQVEELRSEVQALKACQNADSQFISLPPELAEQILDKLSGDLNHDNVAKAKKILRELLDEKYV